MAPWMTAPPGAGPYRRRGWADRSGVGQKKENTGPFRPRLGLSSSSPVSGLIQILVSREREELEQVAVEGHALEDLARLRGAPGAPGLLPHALADLRGLLVENLADEVAGYDAA